jgi:carboxypeptidase C (cathepsin A)
LFAMLALLVLLSGVLVASAAQLPLGTGVDHPLGFVSREDLASATEATLGALSSDEFTLFTHPSLPSYGLRIKQSPREFCDYSVRSYTGYLDVDYGTKHMFFYFFESRSDPDKDDVLMWINGGPGCSG